MGLTAVEKKMLGNAITQKLKLNFTRARKISQAQYEEYQAKFKAAVRDYWLKHDPFDILLRLLKNPKDSVQKKVVGTFREELGEIASGDGYYARQNIGKRIGGNSTNSIVRSPGVMRAASQPTTRNTNSTTLPQIIVALSDIPANNPITTPNWAEQGTASASSRITKKRSLRLSRTRVVKVAIVTHPKPNTIGSTALPFSPKV